jgi:hypothetical protein
MNRADSGALVTLSALEFNLELTLECGQVFTGNAVARLARGDP